MSHQLLEVLFDIAADHATDEQLKELAKDCGSALHTATIDITTLGGLLVKNEGAEVMECHLVENLGDYSQDLMMLKNHIEFVQEQRKEKLIKFEVKE